MWLRIVTFGEGWPNGRAPNAWLHPGSSGAVRGVAAWARRQGKGVRDHLEKPLVALSFMLQSFQAGRGVFDVFFFPDYFCGINPEQWGFLREPCRRVMVKAPCSTCSPKACSQFSTALAAFGAGLKQFVCKAKVRLC